MAYYAATNTIDKNKLPGAIEISPLALRSVVHPFAYRLPTYQYSPYHPRITARTSANMQRLEQEYNDWIANYNDPLEMNSLADLVLTTFDPNMKRVDLGGIEKIPILNIITGLFTDILWDKNIKPIVEGFETGKIGEGFAASGLNLLQNIGESMDVLANPVKAAIQGEDILQALGWAGNGRSNYDIDLDTGSGFVDFLGEMAGEILLDPFNWITLGGKAALSRTAKGGIRTLAQELPEEAIEQVYKVALRETSSEAGEKLTRQMVKDTYVDALSKRATKIYMNQETRILGKKWLTTKGMSYSDALVKAAKELDMDWVVRKFGKGVKLSGFTSDTLLRSVKEIGERFAQMKNNSIVSGIRSVMVASENIERGIMRSVMATGLPGQVFNLVTGLKNKIGTAMYSATKLDAILNSPEANALTFMDIADDGVRRAKDIQYDRLIDMTLKGDPVTVSEHRKILDTLLNVKVTDNITRDINALIDNVELSNKEMLEQFLNVLKKYTGTDDVDEAFEFLRSLNIDAINDRVNTLGEWHHQISKAASDVNTSAKQLYEARFISQYDYLLNEKGLRKPSQVFTRLSQNAQDVIKNDMFVFVRRVNNNYKALGVNSDTWYAFMRQLEAYQQLGDTKYLLGALNRFQPIFEEFENAIREPIIKIEGTLKPIQKSLQSNLDDGAVVLDVLDKLAANSKGIIKLPDEMSMLMKDTTAFKDTYKNIREGIEKLKAYSSTRPYHGADIDYTLSMIDNILEEYPDVIPSSVLESLRYRLNDYKILIDQQLTSFRNKGFKGLAPSKGGTLSEDLLLSSNPKFIELNRELTKVHNKILKLEGLRKAEPKYTAEIVQQLQKLDQQELVLNYQLELMLEAEPKDIRRLTEWDAIEEPKEPSKLQEGLTKLLTEEQQDTYKLIEDVENAITEVQDFVFLQREEFLNGLAHNFQVMYGFQYSKQEVINRMLTLSEVVEVLDANVMAAANAAVKGTVLEETWEITTNRFLEGLQDTQDLLYSIENHPMFTRTLTDDGRVTLANVVRDTIASEDKLLVNSFTNPEFFPRFLDNIKRKVTEQMNSLSSGKRSSMEVLTKDIKINGKPIATITKDLTPHAAQDDVLRQALVTWELAKKDLDPTRLNIIIDIETTDLNTFAGEIREVAMIELNERNIQTIIDALEAGDLATARGLTQSYTIKTKGKIVPSESTLAISLQDAAKLPEEFNFVSSSDGVLFFDTVNKTKQMEAYLAFKNSQALYDDPQQVYKMINDSLYEMSEGKPIKLYSHNGSNFDIPFLNNNVSDAEYTFKQAINNVENVDTLTLARNNRGYKYLSTQEENAIDEIFRQHVRQRASRAIDKDTGIRFLETIDTYKVNEIRRLAWDVIKENPLMRDAMRPFFDMTDAVFVALADVKHFNQEGHRFLFDKSLFGGAVVQADNVTAFLHDLGAYTVASNRLVRADVLGRVFNPMEGATMPNYLELSAYGKKIIETYESISNITHFTPQVKEELQSLSAKLRQSILDIRTSDTPTPVRIKSFVPYEMLRTFDSDDPRMLFASTLQLYKDYQKIFSQNQSEVMKAYNISNDVAVLLNRPYELAHQTKGIRFDTVVVSTPFDENLVENLTKDINNIFSGLVDSQKALSKVGRDLGYFDPLSFSNFSIQRILEDLDQYAYKTLKANALFPETAKNLMINLDVFRNNIAGTQLKWLRTLDEESLYKYVGHKAGYLIVDTRIMENATELADYFKAIKHPDLYVKELDKHTIAFGIKKSSGHKLKKLFEDGYDITSDVRFLKSSDDVVPEIAERYHNKFNELTNGANRMSNDRVITEEYLRNLKDILGEDFINATVDMDTYKQLGMFKNTKFNHSVIGGYDIHKAVDKYTDYNPLKSYVHSSNHLKSKADAMSKIKLQMFDSASPYNIRQLFNDAGVDTIVRELDMNKSLYTAVYMRPDKASATGYAMVQAPINKKVVALAMSGKGAPISVVPKAMFHQMSRVVNKWEINNVLVKFFAQVLMAPLKSGLLRSPGWTFRNAIDSTFKTLAEINNASEGTKAIFGAARYYVEWHKIMKEITEEAGGFANKEAVNKILSKLPTGEQQLFREVYTLFESAAGNGFIKEYVKFLPEKYGADWMDKTGEFLNDAIWNVSLYGKSINMSNEYIEDINRLAVFMAARSQGSDVMESLSRVIRTHFDFKPVSKWQHRLNLVVPFSTFRLSNIVYWADAVTNHGWLATTMNDILTPILNFDEYSNFELNNNRSLQYNLLAGNLILDDNTTIKLGLSVMDAVGQLMNPVDELLGSVNAYFRVPLETVIDQLSGRSWKEYQTQVDSLKITEEEWYAHKWKSSVLTNLPVVGPELMRWYDLQFNRDGELVNTGSAIKAFERTGNTWTKVLPSIVGGVQRLYYFSYPGAKTIYTTANFEKFQTFLLDGATEITSLEQMQALAGQPVKRKQSTATKKSYVTQPKKTYQPRQYPRKRYARKPRKSYVPRKAYARKSYTTGRYYGNTSYIPRSASPMFNIVSYNMLQKNPRAGGRPPILYRSPHTNRQFYKKMYTGRGNSIWASRLLQTNPYTLKYRIRMAWSYLR